MYVTTEWRAANEDRRRRSVQKQSVGGTIPPDPYERRFALDANLLFL
ncbi:hypothetical protein [Kurthia sibirica]|nr:hypothetical protein [Kurthia sibirica]